MKKFTFILLASIALIACNSKKKSAPASSPYTYLRSDTINVVKLTDTLVIGESTCRGCAFEGSTHFGLSDSLGIVEVDHVITTDNSPSDMDGGSISKQIVLKTLKAGVTTVRLYKFWQATEKAEDSLHFTTFTIDVRK